VIWKKKSEDDSLPPAVRSWRQIEQSAQRHVVSVLMRRRRIFTLLRFTGLSLGLVALIVVSGYAVFLFNTRPREMSIALPGEPIRQVVFESNGVLTPDWFARTFELVPHITLMETDIFALKTRLEEVAQIRFATVSRIFPYRLEVVIEERLPVLRARIRAVGGGTREVLVSDDGAVYTGVGYPTSMIDHLPYLGGVRFVENEHGIKPVSGIDTVSRLLSAARDIFPEIYATWKVISCEGFSGDVSDPNGTIRVRSTRVREILFAPKLFDQQLFHLDRVLDYSANRRIDVLKRVDLSLGDQVAVEYFADPLTLSQPRTLQF